MGVGLRKGETKGESRSVSGEVYEIFFKSSFIFSFGMNPTSSTCTYMTCQDMLFAHDYYAIWRIIVVSASEILGKAHILLGGVAALLFSDSFIFHHLLRRTRHTRIRFWWDEAAT